MRATPRRPAACYGCPHTHAAFPSRQRSVGGRRAASVQTQTVESLGPIGSAPPPPVSALADRVWLVRLAVVHNGSIAMEDVIRIAKLMRSRSLAKKFEGTVLEILGTCQSVGCRVDGEDPHDIIDQIHEGEGPELPEE